MLTTYISQLKQYDAKFIDVLANELAQASIDWAEPYPEYASEGLKVAALLNPDGDQANFSYADCHNPVATSLLRRLPELHQYIQQTGFDIMAARLLRLDPGTFLHEHRDYVYLEDVPRFRLHVPLVTNPGTGLTLPGLNIHLKRNFLWKLDPEETIHSACNFGLEPRIHLMMDCYSNDVLNRLIKSEYLDQDTKQPLPPFTKMERTVLMQAAQKALHEGKLKTAEELLLKAFCQFNLGSTTTYDLILELFQGKSDYQARIHYWQERMAEVYPQPGSAPPLMAVAR